MNSFPRWPPKPQARRVCDAHFDCSVDKFFELVWQPGSEYTVRLFTAWSASWSVPSGAPMHEQCLSDVSAHAAASWQGLLSRPLDAYWCWSRSVHALLRTSMCLKQLQAPQGLSLPPFTADAWPVQLGVHQACMKVR